MTPSQTTQHAVLSLDTGLISLATVMVGTYNHRLVVLSLIIAVLSSYAALDLAGRVTSARGRARYLWLSGGALAMAIGI
jgi:NO-binding membrane sensor protein with MHYT domain